MSDNFNDNNEFLEGTDPEINSAFETQEFEKRVFDSNWSRIWTYSTEMAIKTQKSLKQRKVSCRGDQARLRIWFGEANKALLQHDSKYCYWDE